MIISVKDFSKVTGVSKHTVYTWIKTANNKGIWNFPKGVKVSTVGRALHIDHRYEKYDKLKKFVDEKAKV